MKRNSLVSLGLIGIMTLAISGCNGFEEQKLPEPSTKGNFVIMVVPETRTEMSENTVVWSENDKLNVFVAASGSSNYGDNFEFTYDNSSKDRFVGDLNYLPDKSNDWYVLYPYNSAITTPANTSSGAINIGCAAEGYQMQNGNDNMSHLTGQHFPLYGKKLDVSSAQVPSIELNQALSILRIHVTNKNSNPLTVKEVYFTGTEAIAGSFYIGFAGESATMEPAGSTSNTAVLKVNNGTAISTNGSADFYLAIKPFTATSGSTLTLAVNGYEKTLTLTQNVSFKEGQIRTLNFEAPADYYEKVTSAPADWSGQYLIVDETNEIVANGVWNSTKGIKSSDVTITNSRIESTATTDAYAVTISNVSESNYSVYFAETELYVGYSGSSNECRSYESLSNDNTNWTISMSDGAAILTNVAANTRVLRSNFGETSGKIIADNGPFRCYTGDTGNPAVLYKLVDNTVWVLKSIAINPGPTKTTYEEGETFDPTGMVVTATYEDYAGVKADKNVSISHNDLTFFPTLDTELTTDVNEVTISFGGMSLTQAITVTEKVDWTLSGIEVKTPPIKTTYTEGDNFDPSGLVITATYSALGHEDKTEDVTYSNETASNFSFDPATDAQLTTSDASVTISYTVSDVKKTTSQAITVNAAPSGTPGDETFDLSTNTYTTGSNSVTWTGESVTINNSGTNATNYLGGDANNRTSSRFYNGNSLVITPNTDYTITSIVFTATSTNYASVLGNSTWTNGAASVSGTTVTVTPTNGADAVSASVGGTCGFTSIVVNYIYSGVVVTKYAITVDNGIANGSVSADLSEAAEGATVTLTATPASGYALDSWNVYKTGESGTKVTVSANAFTMPAYAVTVSASFAAVPTISMNTTSIADVAAAGVSATAASAYNLLNGASNSDVTITCDGTVVTAASKNATAGSIDYTVASNSSNARNGWIKVKYGTEDPHEITVSQLAGESVTPTLQYTLDGTVTASGNAYATASTVTQSNIGWKVVGNTEQSPWRIGGKGISNTDRAIYSTTAISANITQINVSSGATASSLTVNSMTISVHNSAADAESGSNAIATKTVTSGIASSTVTFDKEDNTSWAGKYYRIVYNVTRTNTSGNGYITFNNATFYGI